MVRSHRELCADCKSKKTFIANRKTFGIFHAENLKKGLIGHALLGYYC